MTIERTAAKIGRSMKKREMFIGRGSRRRGAGVGVGGRDGGRPAPSGATTMPGRTRWMPRDDDAVLGADALADDAQPVVQRPDRHRAVLRLVLGVDDPDELLRLVGADRLVGDEHRLGTRPLPGEPQAREQPGREQQVGVRHDARGRSIVPVPRSSWLSTKSMQPSCGKPSSSARPTSTGFLHVARARPLARRGEARRT